MKSLVKKAVAPAVTALAFLSLGVNNTFAQVTLPDTGVDIGGTIDAMVADFGSGYVKLLLGSAAFIAVGLVWMKLRRIGSGS